MGIPYYVLGGEIMIDGMVKYLGTVNRRTFHQNDVLFHHNVLQ